MHCLFNTEMCGLGGGEVKASQANKRKYFLVEYPHYDCALLKGIYPISKSLDTSHTHNQTFKTCKVDCRALHFHKAKK